ncbi:Amidohydrolase family protein [compost metagenome]
MDTAIHLFTRGSAAAAGEERERGALAAGYFADFTVIDRDITRNSDELLSVTAKMTVVNGIIAYEKA